MIVNYTYGVLTGGLVLPSSVWYRGAKSVTRNKTQEKYLKDLLGGLTSDEIGQVADTIIKLIQCSEMYPMYIEEYDPVNTYHIPVAASINNTKITPITYDRLLAWCSSIPRMSCPYINSKPNDDVQRILNGLFEVLTAHDKR